MHWFIINYKLFSIPAVKQKEYVVFVLGSSGLNAQKRFQYQKQVVKEFLKNNSNSNLEMSLTVVTYGLETAETWPVSLRDKSNQKTYVDNIPWNGPGRRLDLGLTKTSDALQNANPKSRKRVYVFINQAANIHSKPAQKAASKLLNEGAELISVQIMDDEEDRWKSGLQDLFVVKARVNDDPERIALLLVMTYNFGKFPCSKCRKSSYTTFYASVFMILAPSRSHTDPSPSFRRHLTYMNS